MLAFGWTVLALVFLDELLAMAATGIWGWHVGGSTPVSLVLVVLLPLLTMLVWFLFASPKATYGGPAVRPVVKVLVFGAASAALWASGHHGWAVALLVFSVAVNAAAQVPAIRALADSPTR
jgi:hypothetical protein